MKILFMEWKSFGNLDMIEAFQSLGHAIVSFPFSNDSPRNNPEVENKLSQTIKDENPDLVFSFNYFPLISNACNSFGIPYISWVYDNPYVLLYSYTIINPCNLVFVFDKELFYEFHNSGIQTVYYLPMAVNLSRLDNMICGCSFPKKYESEIAFVGALYTEKHQFYERMDFSKLSPHTIGYLEGLMCAQQKVFGYNFIQDCLTAPILDELNNTLPMTPNPDGIETPAYLYAQYMINRKITSLERINLLKNAAKKFTVDLYTREPSPLADNIRIHGPIDYYDEMPYVFHGAKINLNISLRSIKSGIPLRCFDIMGSSGFLLTNFQADLLDFFEPGVDFAFYDSEQDMMGKLEYYLQHDSERNDMVKNVHKKLEKGHTYQHRIEEMLSYISK